MQNTVTLEGATFSLPFNLDSSSTYLNGHSAIVQENNFLLTLPKKSAPRSMADAPNILIIDPSESIGDLIRHSLHTSESGTPSIDPSQIRVACDIPGASRNIALLPPDLIIADWNTIVKSISADPGHHGIQSTSPILLLMDRNCPYPEISTHEITSGIVDCIQKPVNSTELRNRVQLLLGFSDKLKQMKEENIAMKDTLDLKHIELHLELLMHSGSVKDKFVEEISQLSQFLTSEGRSKLKHMVRQFRWAIQDENSVNFVRAFDKINESLYRQLNKVCAGITKNEKRLCAFTRKGQTGAEIAKLLGKTQNCVNVAFARIRTKLKLTNNKDLKTFLLSLE